ncbi:MAG: OmpA family protein, partial [Myxococcota bacterium]
RSGTGVKHEAAAIRAELEPVLAEMLKVVVPYAGDYSFAVEGHTDWNPVKGGGVFGSNWELSSARAIVVRDRLEHVGVGRGQIRIEGYADTKRLPEPVLAGLSDDERLARHRRVVVRIY